MLELIALAFEDESVEEKKLLEGYSAQVSDRVIRLAQSKEFEKEIQAVRLFRRESGASLRDAFDVVEQLKASA